jgi:RNA polymerase sigma-70 factor (sigma-E family)
MTFEEFVRNRLPPLLRFAMVLCGDRGLAEDVVQEVLLRVHPRWPYVEQLDQPEAYIRRMIVNEFLSWRRKWARYVPHADVPAADTTPDPAIGLSERMVLMARLRRLPARQRAVVVLRFYADLSDVEIAADLGCTPSTVRAYLSRALSALRVQVTAARDNAKEA